KIIWKTVVPPESVCGARAGANGSLAVSCTWAFAGTGFQFKSTALTVTGKATPAAWVEMPTAVLPVGEPGTGDSPGTRICSLTALLACTVKLDDLTVEELASSVAPESRVAVKKLEAVEVISVKA